jgi:hypothetical protein
VSLDAHAVEEGDERLLLVSDGASQVGERVRVTLVAGGAESMCRNISAREAWRTAWYAIEKAHLGSRSSMDLAVVRSLRARLSAA